MQITSQRQQLAALIDRKLAELNLPQKPVLLYDPVRYTLSLAGKRVRPYLTLISCGLCRGEVKEALSAAIAIELLHNFTLLHDDIMDRADTRRGEPSVYKKWDAGAAIISGDAMYAKAFKQLQYYGRSERYSKESYIKILDIFLESAQKVCEGQAYDLMFEKSKEISIGRYIHMVEGKTAALISSSLALGGAVAGAEGAQIEELTLIGKNIGIAFQIQDDLLDVIADPAKFGKKRGGDIVEGKKTYLSLLALQRCEGKKKNRLWNILESSDITKQDISEVIAIYEEHNIINDTQKKIQHYYRSAIDHLNLFEASRYKEEMINFLNGLISRKY